jgi:Transposase IS116/IS110/IS902 family
MSKAHARERVLRAEPRRAPRAVFAPLAETPPEIFPNLRKRPAAGGAGYGVVRLEYVHVLRGPAGERRERRDLRDGGRRLLGRGAVSGRKHAASHAGLTPTTHQSGDRDMHGRISKRGSAELRAMLCEAAHHASRPAHPLHPYFARLCVKRGYETWK